MSAFGDGDPRSEICDMLDMLEESGLSTLSVISAAIEALAYYTERAERIAKQREE